MAADRKRPRDTDEIENTAPAPNRPKPPSRSITSKPSTRQKPRTKPASKSSTATAKTSEKPQRTPRETAKKQRLDTVDELEAETEASAPKAPTQVEKKKDPKPKEPYFNPLPRVPDHLRPTPLMFVWGAGNFGQFGMGTSFTGELEKPTRNKLVEEMINEGGAFGEDGAGIEFVASGGMHTLFVDEKGAVRCLAIVCCLI
jgi:regulator of chromosome condensation